MPAIKRHSPGLEEKTVTGIYVREAEVCGHRHTNLAPVEMKQGSHFYRVGASRR